MQSVSQGSGRDTAAWSTMRADRRFLWLWLTVATTLSVAGNVGHAWLTVAAGASRGMAIAWAGAPPALLMLAIHGLPTLGRMLGREDRDRLLTFVVWGVSVGAFGWSAFGIFGFTTAMGVPSAMAWVAPCVIDLSVFGATRGLVLTAPSAARMRIAMRTSGGDAATSPVMAASSAELAATATDAVSSSPSGDPVLDRETTPSGAEFSLSATASGTSPCDVSTAGAADRGGPSGVSGTRELAEQIVAAGAVRKPVETVAAILSAAEGEARKAVIAEHTGVHHSVVTKTLEAAAAYRPKPMAVAG